MTGSKGRPMKPSKIAISIVLCTLIALTLCTTTQAITGNSQPDSTPYVCIVVLFSDAARTQPISYSTGILIAPNIVLTAGHSVLGGAAASVCFDQGPITCQIDENGNVYYETDQPIYNGVPIPYPEFAAGMLAGVKPSKVLQISDVGLIILDTAVQEVTDFPTLPTVGLADTLPIKTDLQVIGYGVTSVQRGNSPYTWDGIISRNSATVELLSTNFQGSNKYIRCTANSAQGKGGVAYGDSGGPVMLHENGQSIVLAVNAFCKNANCAGVTYHTRIDNMQILNWISGYI
jgi:hypothetical protein